MRDREEEEQPEFKVTDRRLFTAEGEPRLDAESAPPRSESPPPRSPAAEPPGEQPRPEPPPAESPHQQKGPIRFEHLVMSLYTTAIFQMGLAANPGEEKRQADLPAAQETIDLLDLLQHKTKGNLTPEEEGLLSESLYALRMSFVELTRAAGRGH